MNAMHENQSLTNNLTLKDEKAKALRIMKQDEHTIKAYSSCSDIVPYDSKDCKEITISSIVKQPEVSSIKKISLPDQTKLIFDQVEECKILFEAELLKACVDREDSFKQLDDTKQEVSDLHEEVRNARSVATEEVNNMNGKIVLLLKLNKSCYETMETDKFDLMTNLS